MKACLKLSGSFEYLKIYRMVIHIITIHSHWCTSKRGPCQRPASATMEDARFGGETRQAIFEDVDTQWVEAGDTDINTKIEFKTIDQERVRDVLVDKVDPRHPSIEDFLDVVTDENVSSAGSSSRFDDPRGSRILSKAGLCEGRIDT